MEGVEGPDWKLSDLCVVVLSRQIPAAVWSQRSCCFPAITRMTSLEDRVVVSSALAKMRVQPYPSKRLRPLEVLIQIRPSSSWVISEAWLQDNPSFSVSCANRNA